MALIKKLLAPQSLCRLALLLVLVFSIGQLRGHKTPSQGAWGRHIAEGRDPTVKEHLQAGFWYGAATRAAVATVLLLGSLAWRRRKIDSTSIKLRFVNSGDAGISSRTFFSVLGIIVVGALAMRLPRMTQSFWGDEADAISSYVHGTLKPTERSNDQGPIEFADVPWSQTFFGVVRAPNNHVLFSVLSRLALDAWHVVFHQPEEAFAEWPCRVAPLLGGIGSLILLALLLRRWDAPRAGLIATAFMALHPWHVRYSTEARGYGLMLFFIVLLFHAITSALERGRWRDWLVFGLVELLLIWTWAGIAHALVTLNVVLFLVIVVQDRDRVQSLLRWITVNLLAAAAFISLYVPILLQVQRVALHSGWMKGREMNATWLHNLLAQPFTGIPYHSEDAKNVSELSWQRLFADSPVITSIGFGLILALTVIGFVMVWKRNRNVALLVTAVFAAVPLITAQFYFVLKDELLAWYLLFTLPCLAICAALGMIRLSALVPRPVRTGLIIAMLALTTASTWPMIHDLMTHPTEDFRGAVQASRGKIEPPLQTGASKVFTVWLWRFTPLYDPRGDTHVRDANALRERMKSVADAHGELFVTVGYRALAESLNADMLKLLDDPALFEKLNTFWAQEALHTLTVYRMK